jgi:hypothetical protein
MNQAFLAVSLRLKAAFSLVPLRVGFSRWSDRPSAASSGRTALQNAYQIAATRAPPFALLRLSSPVRLSS